MNIHRERSPSISKKVILFEHSIEERRNQAKERRNKEMVIEKARMGVKMRSRKQKREGFSIRRVKQGMPVFPMLSDDHTAGGSAMTLQRVYLTFSFTGRLI